MAHFSVGGGVVYDSDEVAEYEETLHKGRTLVWGDWGVEGQGPVAREKLTT